MRLIQEPQELIARYVARKMGSERRDFTNCVGFATVNRDDELTGGVVFNGYDHPTICMHIAVDFLSPALVAAAMHYIFVQLKCRRMTGIINADNVASRRFAEHLGCSLEGVMREASPHGDICIYGLLAADAQKWLKPLYLRKLERALKWDSLEISSAV